MFNVVVPVEKRQHLDNLLSNHPLHNPFYIRTKALLRKKKRSMCL